MLVILNVGGVKASSWRRKIMSIFTSSSNAASDLGCIKCMMQEEL